MLSTLGNIYSADDTLKYLSYFSEKTGFDISCSVSTGDNLHEMSNPVFCLFLFFFSFFVWKN